MPATLEVLQASGVPVSGWLIEAATVTPITPVCPTALPEPHLSSQQITDAPPQACHFIHQHWDCLVFSISVTGSLTQPHAISSPRSFEWCFFLTKSNIKLPAHSHVQRAIGNLDDALHHFTMAHSHNLSLSHKHSFSNARRRSSLRFVELKPEMLHFLLANSLKMPLIFTFAAAGIADEKYICTYW